MRAAQWPALVRRSPALRRAPWLLGKPMLLVARRSRSR